MPNNNDLLQCIFKTLMPGQRSLLIALLALVHLDTTGSFLSVSMSKLWVPKSMVKLSSMLYLAVIQQLAFLATVRAGASKLGITTP